MRLMVPGQEGGGWGGGHWSCWGSCNHGLQYLKDQLSNMHFHKTVLHLGYSLRKQQIYDLYHQNRERMNSWSPSPRARKHHRSPMTVESDIAVTLNNHNIIGEEEQFIEYNDQVWVAASNDIAAELA
ncbi:hypothetical protein CY34DRAFT_109891 [Suillus luteus UH-Slu-Lm8-n1]|uniref:Uncharacterized protein n=1 Tax=Suillus luteus UH-Slu-Lm8-n1 TaxID=930992 RepID=A0A0D0AMN3_9AGAM|nr:hypothetical protein CY34DRAFT_109891 [Suillus luteus UH-Slu-Lm8-n1]